MASSAVIDSIVMTRLSSALSEAGIIRAQANDYAQQAVTASSGYFRANEPKDIKKPVIEITNFTPNEDLGGLFRTEFSGALKDLRDGFLPLYDQLMAKFYPANDKLTKDLNDWLSEAILRGGMGLPDEAERAIVQRGRDRETEMAMSLKDAAVNDLASRGFTMLNGPLMARFRQIETEAGKRISELNRDTTIDMHSKRIETVKFAISEAARLQRDASESISRLVSEYARLGGMAAAQAGALIDAKKGTWQATAEYYRSRIAVEQLALEVDKTNIDNVFRVTELNARNHSSESRIRADVATSVADMMSKSAAALMNAQNTVVQLSNNSK